MNKLFKTKKDFFEFKKWIQALDSGNYIQVKRRLNDSNRYCCLGVACRVLIEKKKLFLDHLGDIQGGNPTVQKNAPNWLKKINNDFEEYTNYSLTQLNDEFEFSFSEIATCLELVYIHGWFDEKKKS